MPSSEPISVVIPRNTFAADLSPFNIPTMSQADEGGPSAEVAQAASTIDESPNGPGDEANTTPETSKKGPDNNSTPESRNNGGDNNLRRDGRVQMSPTPHSAHNNYPPAYPAHHTPQQPGGYYGYQSQSQVTPEPPSPAGHGGTAVYDAGSFFQQPGPFGHHPSPFGANTPQQPYLQPPGSPSRSSTNMGVIPPASPLFPRVSGQGAGLVDSAMPRGMMDPIPRGTPLSPAPPYLSPNLGPSVAMYSNHYGAPPNAVNGPNGAAGGSNNSNSPEDVPRWGDRSTPQTSAHGIPIPYVPGMPRTGNAAGGRSFSFEETILPPAAIPEQQDGNPGYSPYGSNQAAGGGGGGPGIGGAGGTLFAHQQPWGYGGPPDMYNPSASPLQPRPTHTMQYPGMPGGTRHHMYNQYYATSPGPPIQTTPSNKGPDGANLFIFHIPNHFTNPDMYQLFSRYGNLLSVRIMVEKDTGRSRGFGFVSYDSPDAAAQAIKELNGFAIGNKRLKVQHKQIKPSDHQSQQHDRNNNAHGGPGYNLTHGDGPYGNRGHPSQSLPPSGPMAGWYGGAPQQTPMDGPGDDGELGNDDGGAGGVVPGSTPPGTNNSPLASLEPLRQALPDVGGPAGN